MNRDLTKELSMKGELGPYQRTFNERRIGTLPKNFQWKVIRVLTKELSMKGELGAYQELSMKGE